MYVDALIARDRDTDANGTLDERLYVVQDANFNVTALVDTSGTVVERFAYDPFGGFAVLTAAFGARTATLYAWRYLHQGLRWDAGRRRVQLPEPGVQPDARAVVADGPDRVRGRGRACVSLRAQLAFHSS